MRIHWNVFDENTSTREALYEFIHGEIKSFKALNKACWPLECKIEINKMKKLGIDKARNRTKRTLRRWRVIW